MDEGEETRVLMTTQNKENGKRERNEIT